jgi:hypothetical protein
MIFETSPGGLDPDCTRALDRLFGDALDEARKIEKAWG